MPGVTAALPGHLAGDSPSATALQRAFEALPPESQSDVIAQLGGVVAHYDETSDVAPLRHFVNSLMLTARLWENERVRTAVGESEAEDARRGGPPVEGADVADLVVRMRAKYDD